MSSSENTSDTSSQVQHGSKDSAVAQRYVRALYELAEQQGRADKITSDMQTLAALVKSEAGLRRFIHHPRIHSDVAAEAVRGLAEAGKMQNLTRDFLVLLAQNRRLGILGEVAEIYLEHAAAGRGETNAEVVSAMPLLPEQREHLVAELETFAGRKVVMQHAASPDLLGGVVVKIGSYLIDASLRGRLESIERALKA